ncbi:putative cop9 signalosome complex subunit 12 protein [Neofusicoccum parvum UCRNP2]|uniref:Protein CSN12 homolog n=2 Tax=Neofusicoccum parvum TaxID=310453 RepID=R1GK32_BOTPV|nr:putative cop9 signalosome complex subunit 12 protein [Neofusicoccum parvum UCRNP2]GME23170.1 Cop9 signalosome complex subunit 12 [Neofusicoccum parvum]
MEPILSDFRRALAAGDGYGVAATITPAAPPKDAGRLYAFHRSTNVFSVQSDIRHGISSYNSNLGLTKAEVGAWTEVYVTYWKAVAEVLNAEETSHQGQKEADWSKVYDAWKDVINALIKGYSGGHFPAWTIPCLYVAAKYLRIFAIKADENAAKAKGKASFNAGFSDDITETMGKNDKLEDAARQINRLFSLCISDREPLEDSRKWALYYIANILFKTYFKLNAVSLSKNVLRSLHAARGDMPPLSAFPKSHQVTFKYYSGVLSFLDEDYKQAEEHLTEAWRLCYKDASKNRELILTYLIPCHLLTTHTLPTQQLLGPYPRLQQLFTPLATCIKKGDLAGFDAALVAGEEEFVKRRIYLTLERGRDIVLRNLLRKVFTAGGFEPLKEGQTENDKIRRTRIPVAEFGAALNLSMARRDGESLDNDEIECLLANMIYKSLMKGYIAREHGKVVLSKAGAFPGTGV